MEKEPILYLNKKDDNFYFEIEAANKIGIDASIPYSLLYEKGEEDLSFSPHSKIETIYHYCNFETFQKIMQSGVFRLSNSRDCNDSEELIYSIRKLDQLFLKYIEDFQKKKTQPELILKEIESAENSLQKVEFLKEKPEELQRIKKDIETLKALTVDQLETFLTTTINNYRTIYEDIKGNVSSTYIACFSKDKDSLSQWRGYGDDGKGIAIGFNVDKLIQLREDKVVLNQIVYHSNIQLSILEKALLHYSYDQNSIKDWIYHILPVIKPHGFKEEQECRLIYLPKDGGKLNMGQMYSNNKMRYFYEIQLSKMGICEITIGPKSGLTPLDVCYYLRKEGIEIEEHQIKVSELSYR